MFERLGEIINGILLPFSKLELYPVVQNSIVIPSEPVGLIALMQPTSTVEDSVSFTRLRDPTEKYSGCRLLQAKLVMASGLFPGLIASNPETYVAETIQFSNSVGSRPGIGPSSDDILSSEVVPDLDGLDVTRDLKDQQGSSALELFHTEGCLDL